MLRFGWLAVPCCAVALALLPTEVRAGAVADRIARDQTLRCGAAERAGVAELRAEGGVVGLAVDLCRALAIATEGAQAKVAFTVYEDDRDFERARRNDDDVYFFTGDDVAEHRLAGAMLPGPIVFEDRLSVLVPVASPIVALGDFAGQSVCVLTGSPGQRALEAQAARWRLDIVRLPFSEDVELNDAYAVGRCAAMVGAAVDLARLRGPMGVNRLRSRLLEEPLARVPVLAATGVADPVWAARAFWLLYAIMDEPDAPGEAWAGDPLARPAASLGLRAGWRDDVRAALGGWREMQSRHGAD